MTTKGNIRKWLEEGKKEKARWMVVKTDWFDYSDYPVFCQTKEELENATKRDNSDDRVMEVYNFGMDLEKQLNEERAYHK